MVKGATWSRFSKKLKRSGQFFTVVTELEVENLAAWEQGIADIFSMPAFGDWFARMTPLVESGRREFYNIET